MNFKEKTMPSFDLISMTHLLLIALRFRGRIKRVVRVERFQYPIVLWWPLSFRLGVAILLLKQMSTIQQTFNARFSGVNLVFILLKRDQRRRETTITQLFVKRSLRTLNQITKQKSHFSNSIPANSHALGVSLTPAGWKLRSHAGSRLRANFSRLIEKCELLPSCLTQFPNIW